MGRHVPKPKRLNVPTQIADLLGGDADDLPQDDLILRPRSDDEIAQWRGDRQPLPKEIPRWVARDFNYLQITWSYSELIQVVRATPSNDGIKRLWIDLHEQHKNEKEYTKKQPGIFTPLQWFGEALRNAVTGTGNKESEYFMSKAERDAIADEVKANAKALSKELEILNLRSLSAGAGSPWYHAKWLIFREITDQLTHEKVCVPNPMGRSTYEEGWCDAVMAFLEHPKAFASAIDEGVDYWLNKPRAIKQIGASKKQGFDPARTYFVHEMHKFFKKRYDETFHERIADLAKLFFPDARPVLTGNSVLKAVASPRKKEGEKKR